MSRTMKIVIPIAILVGGFLLMRLFISLKEEQPKREPELRPKTVAVQVVKPTSLEASITAFGKLVTAQPVDLIAEVEGEVLEGQVPFRPGQSFRKGQILLKVDDRQVRLEVNSAKSDLLNALATVLPEFKIDFPSVYSQWESWFSKINFTDELPEMPEVSDQKIKLFLSRYNVFKLYFNARNAEIRLKKHTITAQFDGAVVTTDVRAGSTARRNNRLGTIINTGDLEVEVPVQSSDISWIDRSRPVRLTSAELPGLWSGRIVRVGSAINSQTQTVPVYLAVDPNSANPLFEGTFLKAEIPGKTVTNAVRIPRSIFYKNEFVYLVNGRVFEQRMVAVGRYEINDILVTGGLNSGDTLVTEVLQGVAPGMPATPVLEAGK